MFGLDFSLTSWKKTVTIIKFMHIMWNLRKTVAKQTNKESLIMRIGGSCDETMDDISFYSNNGIRFSWL